MPDTIYPFICGICCKHFQSISSYLYHFKDHELNINSFLHDNESSSAQRELKSDNFETISKVCSFRCLDCQSIIAGICKVQEHILLQDYVIQTSNSYSLDRDKNFTFGKNEVNDVNEGSFIETDKFQSSCGTINFGSTNNEIVTERSDSCVQEFSGEKGAGKHKLDSEKSKCLQIGDKNSVLNCTSRDENGSLIPVKSNEIQPPEFFVARKILTDVPCSRSDKETISEGDLATNNDGERHKVLTLSKNEMLCTHEGIFINVIKTDNAAFEDNSSAVTNERDDNSLNCIETECNNSFVKSNNELNNEPLPSTSSKSKDDEEWSKEDLIDVATNHNKFEDFDWDSENNRESHEHDDGKLDGSKSANREEVSDNVINVVQDEFDGDRQIDDEQVDVDCVDNKKRNKVKRKAKYTSKADDKLPCDVCGILFNKKNLQRHRLSHTDVKIHKCNICNKYFKTKDQLYSHKLYHNTRKDQMCHYCGKAFNNGPNLRQHVKIHTREKTLKCPFCPKMFRSNFILKDHVNRHSDNKPFICEHCGKSFRTGNELQRHARVHSTERPHPCSYCDKTFKSRSNRIKHEKTHKTLC